MTSFTKQKILLYTDGACSKNPGPGGWGFVLIHEQRKRKCSGFESDTTNNKMELTAVIKGLNYLTKPSQVVVYTDSQYVMKGFTENWIKKWKSNQWKTSTRQDVKNKELWIELVEQVEKHDVTWQWVKGHSGNEYNEMCDEYARKAIINKSGIDEKF